MTDNATENPQGFTDTLKTICAGRCGDYGEPPCWKLPELVEPCEIIEPCAECLAMVTRAHVMPDTPLR